MNKTLMSFVKTIKPWLPHALRVGLALGIAALLTQIRVDNIEALTYDFRVRLKPTSPVSGDVEIINIDQHTQRLLERIPDAKDHRKLLTKLFKAQPRAVVYVVDPSQIHGSDLELAELTTVAEEFSVYMAHPMLLEDELADQYRLPYPLDGFKVVSSPKTSDDRSFAYDGVTRRAIFSFLGEPVLNAALASSVNGLQPDDYGGLFKFKRTTQAYVDFRPTGTYRAASFLSVMNDEIPADRFRDKIVLIGRDTKAEANDYITTPFSRDVTAMSLAEYHANVLDTFILNRAPILPPAWVNFLVTALISLLTVMVVLMLRPAKGLLILGITLAIFIGVSHLLFASAGVWLGMTHPLIAIFVCYYFFIPYRLIIENRKSWEYYQKNALLTQVEELKSNFLQMMSHDLKTPIARIQGMAHMVMTDSQPVSDSQREALYTIQKSTDELNEFIGSILNLSRIESKEIRLQLKSKDINTLLKTIIEKLDYLAKKKNIGIITEFEPLFSIKVDEDLLRQVFTNLLENAIKYSPEESKILISTEEMGGQVLVQVADQGVGIPKEEQENIFMKFYRSKDAQISPIKGSGLGLYLSNYFVNLHHGTISVESEPQHGSTFTVSLPTDLS
ncbi:MAG: CHASE2 domain-containing protein [Pseudobdellovibrionaceae bacterium]|nr:CHASE2 domain-containing protein [Bdellovibrionales bacterium]USN47304.1 MAG: CHASE2 domain-containing protein [Pseudobdellovibrionaceae bacterium]